MALRITRVYTRTGDDGKTGLASGDRLPKNHPRIEAIGTIDELAAQLGVVRCELKAEQESFRDSSRAHLLDQLLEFICNMLFTVGGDLATPRQFRHPSMQIVTPDDATFLEKACDAWNAHLPPLTDFILPGGTRTAAALHFARTIARRAERCAITLTFEDEPYPDVVIYLNRLSDTLFILARCANLEQGGQEIIWRRELPSPTLPME
ncbi:cob(I)yrinic acid a,c-diamide adenosyltransferase [Candidatus Sumerlaeota bacterium]|nr:cob(I)yrinic acid a,c-diamide adenosyltransferase [Candidatus Sumerlaeota bacterium]